MLAKYRSYMMLGILAGLAVAGISTPASAASPDPLQEAVQHGKHLFMDASFGGNGRHCNSCHRGGGTEAGQLPDGTAIPSLNNAASIFPRFNRRRGAVITLQDQVHNCIQGALQGIAPAPDSKDMVALVSYLTSLSQGKPIDMGGQPQ